MTVERDERAMSCEDALVAMMDGAAVGGVGLRGVPLDSELAAHVAECADCSAAWEDQRATREALAGVLWPVAGDGFEGELRAIGARESQVEDHAGEPSSLTDPRGPHTVAPGSDRDPPTGLGRIVRWPFDRGAALGLVAAVLMGIVGLLWLLPRWAQDLETMEDEPGDHGWRVAEIGGDTWLEASIKDARGSSDAPPVSMLLRDELALIGSESGLDLVDVRVPDRPTLLRRLSIPGLVTWRVEGDVLYALGRDRRRADPEWPWYDGQLDVYDLRRPALPKLTWSSSAVGPQAGDDGDDPFDDASKLLVEEGRLIVVQRGAVNLFDLDQPLRPAPERRIALAEGALRGTLYRADPEGQWVEIGGRRTAEDEADLHAATSQGWVLAASRDRAVAVDLDATTSDDHVETVELEGSVVGVLARPHGWDLVTASPSGEGGLARQRLRIVGDRLELEPPLTLAVPAGESVHYVAQDDGRLIIHGVPRTGGAGWIEIFDDEGRPLRSIELSLGDELKNWQDQGRMLRRTMDVHEGRIVVATPYRRLGVIDVESPSTRHALATISEPAAEVSYGFWRHRVAVRGESIWVHGEGQGGNGLPAVSLGEPALYWGHRADSAASVVWEGAAVLFDAASGEPIAGGFDAHFAVSRDHLWLVDQGRLFVTPTSGLEASTEIQLQGWPVAELMGSIEAGDDRHRQRIVDAAGDPDGDRLLLALRSWNEANVLEANHVLSVAVDDSGVRAVASWQLESSETSGGEAPARGLQGIAVDRGHAFVAIDDELRVLELSADAVGRDNEVGRIVLPGPIADPVPAARSAEEPASAEGPAYLSVRAFEAGQVSDLHILDVSDPSRPEWVETIRRAPMELRSREPSVAIVGAQVVSLDEAEIQVGRIGEPDALRVIKVFETFGEEPTGVHAWGDRLLFASWGPSSLLTAPIGDALTAIAEVPDPAVSTTPGPRIVENKLDLPPGDDLVRASLLLTATLVGQPAAGHYVREVEIKPWTLLLTTDWNTLDRIGGAAQAVPVSEDRPLEDAFPLAETSIEGLRGVQTVTVPAPEIEGVLSEGWPTSITVTVETIPEFALPEPGEAVILVEVLDEVGRPADVEVRFTTSGEPLEDVPAELQVPGATMVESIELLATRTDAQGYALLRLSPEQIDTYIGTDRMGSELFFIEAGTVDERREAIFRDPEAGNDPAAAAVLDVPFAHSHVSIWRDDWEPDTFPSWMLGNRDRIYVVRLQLRSGALREQYEQHWRNLRGE